MAMSVVQQLSIHSLFQAATFDDVRSGLTWERQEEEEEDDAASNESCEEDTTAFDLALSNLTGSSDFGCNVHGSTIDEEEDDEESTASSSDSCDSESSLEYQPHYQSRLEATQKLISTCVITGKTTPNLRQQLEKPSPDSVGEDTFFPLDVPARAPVQDETVNTCFDSVQLFSPTYFACPKQSPASMESATTEERSSKSSNLSSMIHPMSSAGLAVVTPSCDRKMNTSSTPRAYTPDFCSPLPKPESKYSANNPYEQETSMENIPRGSSKLQSAFKSSTVNDRIEYCLSTGKSGMTPQLRKQSRQLLPDDPLKRVLQMKADENSCVSDGQLRSGSPDETLTRSLKLATASKTTLSILLLECHQKIFEIVAVEHVTAETSVGDVLSRARAQATDPRLSLQTYVSLCNSVNEMAAMMLPVHLMMNANKTNTGILRKGRKHGETTLKKYDRLEAASRRHGDPSLGRLLVAVPEGSTAETVRQIQKALWSHPRIQRWWKKENCLSGNKSGRKETI